MAEVTAEYVADGELAKLLEEAADSDRPLRVNTDDGSYEVRVRREGSPLRRVEDYDPERARQGLEESFGALVGLDVEAFLAEIKANRE